MAKSAIHAIKKFFQKLDKDVILYIMSIYNIVEEAAHEYHYQQQLSHSHL